jgi:Zn-dependent peptidase ImmA (M78 family)
MENQSFELVGPFLLPEKAFLSDIYQHRTIDLDVLKKLKYKWRVSIALMIQRLKKLHILTDEQHRSLFINLNKRRWRINEPYDELIERDEPSLISKSFKALENTEYYKLPKILESSPFDAQDINEIFNIFLKSSESRKSSTDPIVKSYKDHTELF